MLSHRIRMPGGAATRDGELTCHRRQRRWVFQTLAPVLLTGRPDPMAPIMSRTRLVPDADAADYRDEI
jgi:hypothetical protein